MKTVEKIDPEKEYENAKKILDEVGEYFFNEQSLHHLDSNLTNLITVVRVFIEREQLRKGKPSPPKTNKSKGRNEGETRAEVKKLPSERYPNLEVQEDVILPKKLPTCPCCHSKMKESGLFDVTEKLEIIPKRYYIYRCKRPKYNCGKCHGAMINTAALPSIVPTSNYGDGVIIDVSLSKFCDLMPMERYVQIAARSGMDGLPAQSLIGLTHHLADFLMKVYLKIKFEVQQSALLLADETTHNMLEGDETPNWYLWGFFSQTASYYETHGTRSGDVVYDFLVESKASFLMSDGYTGYNKAVKKVKKDFARNIVLVDCNAHAIRKFKEAAITWKEECRSILKTYREIYDLEKKREKLKTGKRDKEYREKMAPLFDNLKSQCEEALVTAMPKSNFAKAIQYFLNHFTGLSFCAQNALVPLDNNHSERGMRSPVVGRKTWYGTHSKRGAQTTAIHFSIIESCKVNNVNPRSYYPWVVEQLLSGREALTPYDYRLSVVIQ
jgi:transposase